MSILYLLQQTALGGTVMAMDLGVVAGRLDWLEFDPAEGRVLVLEDAGAVSDAIPVAARWGWVARRAEDAARHGHSADVLIDENPEDISKWGLFWDSGGLPLLATPMYAIVATLTLVFFGLFFLFMVVVFLCVAALWIQFVATLRGWHCVRALPPRWTSVVSCAPLPPPVCGHLWLPSASSLWTGSSLFGFFFGLFFLFMVVVLLLGAALWIQIDPAHRARHCVRASPPRWTSVFSCAPLPPSVCGFVWLSWASGSLLVEPVVALCAHRRLHVNVVLVFPALIKPFTAFGRELQR